MFSILKFMIMMSVFVGQVLLITKVPNDYDQYGIKIAANDWATIAADNVYSAWWCTLQITTNNPFMCYIGYNYTSCDFVYSTIAPISDSSVFIYNCIDLQGNHIIGFFDRNTSCNYQVIDEKVILDYATQDNFIIAIDGDGTGVYGFADDFVLFYSLLPPFQLTIWPNAFNISPRAVDIGSNMYYAVVVGYCQVAPSLAVECGIILTLNQSLSLPTQIGDIDINSHLNFSWSDPRINHRVAQSRVYSTDTMMSLSVALHSWHILIGIPSINMVLLYAFDNVSRLISTRQNGIGVSGFGKSVAWLPDKEEKAVILDDRHVYGTDQSISSHVHVYDIASEGFTDEVQPICMYPNSEQVLFRDVSSVLIRLISTKSGHVVIFDNLGNSGVLLRAPAGMYPSTKSHSMISSAVPCIAGTYRNYPGLELCIPCPNGTFSSACEPCLDNDSFCPQGSIQDLSYSAFESIEQEQDYPESPEVTVFDDLLMSTMFNVHTKSSYCILVSPMTWVLTVLTLGIIVATAIVVAETHYPHKQMGCSRFRAVLQKLDLIGEGELWVGGLFSISIVVLLISSYAFSNIFVGQYPIETATKKLSLECGSTLYNAKFSTSMQKMPSSGRSTKHIQPMFELLRAQPFELRIDLIQTAFTCHDSLVVYHVIDYTLLPLSISRCESSHNGSILSLGISLSSHDIIIQLTLPGLRTIGAIRLGLFGPSATMEDGRYTLLALNFASTFVPSSISEVLAPSTVFVLQLTPIVNQTAPLSTEGAPTFSAIWSSSLDVKTSELFTTETRYTFFQRMQTNITVTMEQTVFYVNNVQEPIARQTEIIFRTLLFTIVVLEIFGLIFLIKKLLIIPLYRSISNHANQHFLSRKKNKVQAAHNMSVIVVNPASASRPVQHPDGFEAFE